MRIRLAPVMVAGLGLLLATGVSFAQVQPCEGEGCIEVNVSSPPATPPIPDEGTFETTISFVQGSEARGLNDQAAIAFTLSLPSLILANCENPTADGLTSAVSVPQAVADNFRVVIENSVCTDDSKPCLCPTNETQPRASYANVVIFGPKVLPTPGSGSVDFPLLPNGPLITLTLQNDGATTTPLTLHLYNETDNQATTPKPQFGAFLSVGDTNAVDDTVNRDTNTSNVKVTDGIVEVETAVAACACDCDGNMRVTGGEITRCVNILGRLVDLDTCPAADSDKNGTVTGSDITRGVAALGAGLECTKF